MSAVTWAKNYGNWWMCVKAIACQSWDVFETHCIMWFIAKINKNLAIANRSRVSCAQYAEGIYRPKCYTVTLKSRLRVTQGHWKRNHWTDHTRLSSSRVI